MRCVEYIYDIYLYVYIARAYANVMLKGMACAFFAVASFSPVFLAWNPHYLSTKHCRKPEFSPFPTMFSTLSESRIIIFSTLILSSAGAFILDQSKVWSFRKELRDMHH